jgi:O-antigen biosynthesis protein
VKRRVSLGVGTADSEDHEAGPVSAVVQPQPSRLIDWTGERCVPWAPDHQMIYEHMHRYNFAASFCIGKRVLDLASGEGYGSAILGGVASDVVGVDIDSASVEHAGGTYGTDHVRFTEGSMLDPDLFADHSFDVVVCFEALEHVGDHDLLLKVILGALCADGLVVISTPDRTVYTDLHHQNNPFHVHELDRQEFRDVLRGHFKHVGLLTHEVATGSVMQALDGGRGSELIRVSGMGGWTRQATGEPPYLVALASDGPLPEIPSVSTLIDTDLLLARRPPALTQLQEEVARLNAQASGQDAQIERLEGSVRTLAEEARAAVAQLNWELGAIKATKGWRALERMRRQYRQVRRLGRPLRRFPPFRRTR